MSFITSTYECRKCGKAFNVALGTFGYGMPKKCPQDSCNGTQFKLVADGWYANEDGTMGDNKL